MSILRSIKRKVSSFFERKSYALNDLDIRLRPYINFRKGFFVEAGANDGIAQSNTLYFEKYMGWTGLLIEPVPELAAECRINRPGCIVENCALVPLEYEKDFVEMRYCNLMSLVKGSLGFSEMEEAHIKRGCEIQNVLTYALRVPVRTLTSVLDQYSIGGIDFFSLDVEGYELNVLKGIDFGKYRPTVMLIEALETHFKDKIDSFLYPFYEPIAMLSEHDVLYRCTQS